MATITAATSGNWSSTSTWVGGVVPVEGDAAVIPAGMTVTVDGTITAGDGSNLSTIAGGAIRVSGTLRASRSVSSSFTARGRIVIGAGGMLDYGTDADPIPAGIVAELILNKLNGGTQTFNIGLVNPTTSGTQTYRYYFCGSKTRTRIAKLASNAAAGATSIVLDTAAHGWQVGDSFHVVPASGGPYTVDQTEIRAVSGIAGATISFATPLVYLHLAGANACNRTCNVIVRPFSNVSNQQSHIYIQTGGNGTQDFIAIDTLFIDLGRNSNEGAISYQGLSKTTACNLTLDRCVLLRSATGGIMVYNAQSATPIIVRDSVIRGDALIGFGGTGGVFERCDMGSLGQANNGAVVDGCWFSDGAGALAINYGATFKNCTFSGRAQMITSNNTALGIWENCDFGSGYGITTILSDPFIRVQVAYNSYNHRVRNSVFAASLLNPLSVANSIIATDMDVFYENVGNDPTVQIRYKKTGIIARDNATIHRGVSSKQFSPYGVSGNLDAPLTTEQNIPLSPGQSITVIGYVRCDATFWNGGNCNLPTATLGYPGGTAATFTASAAMLNGWERFSLTVTNSSGSAKEATLTLSCSAKTAVTGNVWFDGVPEFPFVNIVRHYGYLFEESAITRKANPRITQTENAVAAITSIAIDHDLKTVTISGSVSIDDIYHYYQYSLVQPENISIGDSWAYSGTSLNIADYDVSVSSGGITGDENDYLETTGSVSGLVAIRYADASGTHTAIAAPNLQNGTRVQLWDVDADTEISNGVVSGSGGYRTDIVWTADKTIRLRATAVGKLRIEATALLTNTGAIFLQTQSNNTVYIDNGIDWTTCTEFTADYPNVQVDIDDPDGVTTVQRLYAWLEGVQTTQQGIREFFGAVDAEDAVNYRVNAAVVSLHLDNTGATPVVLVGGRIYRSDGATIIAATSGSIQIDPDKAYVPTASIWGATIEGNKTSGDLLRITAAVAAGKTSVSGTDPKTVIFRDVNDTRDVVTATVDGAERTAVTLDPS